MLNEQGYPLEAYDFYNHVEFEEHFSEAEIAIDEMSSDVDYEEHLNDEQRKVIKHHLDGASGAIYQARELFQQIVDAKIEASAAYFEAEEKAEMAGTE